jgi:hypothetical protein
MTFRRLIKKYIHFTNKVILHSLFKFTYKKIYMVNIHERVCSMCNLNVVKDEYHFILQYEKYIDVRRRYLKKYYWQMPSCFKLVQLLSVQWPLDYIYIIYPVLSSFRTSHRVYSNSFIQRQYCL